KKIQTHRSTTSRRNVPRVSRWSSPSSPSLNCSLCSGSRSASAKATTTSGFQRGIQKAAPSRKSLFRHLLKSTKRKNRLGPLRLPRKRKSRLSRQPLQRSVHPSLLLLSRDSLHLCPLLRQSNGVLPNPSLRA